MGIFADAKKWAVIRFIRMRTKLSLKQHPPFAEDDIPGQIYRTCELKARGIISEEQFIEKIAKLLSLESRDELFELEDFIKNEIPFANMRNAAPGGLIKMAKKKFGISSLIAARLVQTEQSFFRSHEYIEHYSEVGYKKYAINTYMGEKTPEICRSLNEAVFKFEDFIPGVTAPPFHPECCSCVVPFESASRNNQISDTARNPSTNKVERIPQGMSIKEWYEQCVCEVKPTKM